MITKLPEYSEKKAIQDEIVELFKKMGYEYIPPQKTQNLRNNNLKTVLLEDILKNQLIKINSYEYKNNSYKFSEKNIKQAIKDLDIDLGEGVVTANEKIYKKLILGESYTENLTDGNNKSYNINYIDWKNPENNIYHFTEEYTVEKQDLTKIEKHKRLDIVVFINGIPIGVIELKKDSIFINEGIKQIINYQNNKNIPHLFKYAQIVMAGNNNEVKYATAGTDLKFWSIWDEEHTEIYDKLNKLITHRTITKLDKNIYSLFNKNRIIEIIKSYILFDGKVKKIARYQQYFAIKEAVENINTFDKFGKRTGGLIWHTQGSGKSLTMVLLAKEICRTIPNSKIIIVTDRIHLDKQIKNTFNNAGFKGTVLRAESGKKLAQILMENKSTVITTVINKFNNAMDNKISVNSSNIFVMVDEGHRTQYGELHSKMKTVLPNACYIGFTGTPLMKKDKNSFDKFHRLIHKYTMDKAVKDGAVVPLLYESKLVHQKIDKNIIDEKFNLISKKLNEAQAEDLKNKWARFSKIASSESRIELIAMDIISHYRNYLEDTEFNAILATNSKFEAVRYYKTFEKYGQGDGKNLKDIETAFIISPPNEKEGASEINKKNKKQVQEEWDRIIEKYGELQYEESIKNKFIDGDIDIIIVVDKLLTGFDAPKAKVLYIDKELKDHTLLQAIARVNRVFEGKDYGVIVDYRGLLGNLDKAITSYSSLSNFEEEDVINTLIDIKEEINLVKTIYSHLKDLFKNVKSEKEDISISDYTERLENETLRYKFYDLLKDYSKALKNTLSSDKIYKTFKLEEIKEYKNYLKFCVEVRNSASIRYCEKIDFGEMEPQMQKLIDAHVDAIKIEPITSLVNIFDVDKFNSIIIRVEGKKAKADAIKNAIKKQIKKDMKKNPAFYEKLSKKIEEVLKKYQDKRLTEEEYLKEMEATLQNLRNEESEFQDYYPECISNNSNAKAIYENVEEYVKSNGLKQNCDDCNEIIGHLSLKFDEIIKYNRRVDWKKSPDIQKRIKRKLYDEIWELDKKNGLNLNENEIVEKVIELAINRYGD
ncbi:MAG: type I restriction endonuclease subunit R [Methanosarcinales archaeon]|jgi:type I restriction enzyme R subunit|nr:type I restriction endonuclease subunit R [Methanosarcinales archaeon]